MSLSFVSAKGSIPVNNKKHCLDSALTDPQQPPAKKMRVSQASSTVSSPLGLKWDKEDLAGFFSRDCVQNQDRLPGLCRRESRVF